MAPCRFEIKPHVYNSKKILPDREVFEPSLLRTKDVCQTRIRDASPKPEIKDRKQSEIRLAKAAGRGRGLGETRQRDIPSQQNGTKDSEDFKHADLMNNQAQQREHKKKRANGSNHAQPP